MKQLLLSRKVLGFIIPNLCTALIALITKLLASDGSGNLVFSEFVILPMLMGIFSAWFWKTEEYNTAKAMGRAGMLTIIAILLSFLFLGEGSICLVIVSPLLFAFIGVGLLFGRRMFGYGNGTLNVSIVSLLLLIFIADNTTSHSYQNMVADKIVVNAPVEKVWPYVVAYERINKPAGYFLFRLGMPSPVQSTVTGYRLGAGRKCIFSNGYTFEEKITEFEPNKKLTFAITEQPKDPEIMGHIDIQKGQFILQDNGNGTTTLTGNSWYALHVFPVWYYDLWAESVTRNVHLRVMDHIKELSERK
ncbi:SRPBCC family protein [Mucilaginibacter myungsuensis]|uniref:SRPBCC family protein n=1 Tax=Mucilaginibacter myungsuensis TaxID=649104 RepID=A0A929PY46_9SPHI|nr:SRPBCC family protein [Mucilaginibacter myungsuensis]MBE9663799.1 SRPBCC family protein [Mucilaginibacter myungsuensis]MDN3598486.1 SRPBCC family protein [Mucilaginibacter myungsuensis]